MSETRQTRTVVLATEDLPDYIEWLAENDFTLISSVERQDGHYDVTFAFED